MTTPNKKISVKAFDAVARMHARRWYSPNDLTKFHITAHRARSLLEFTHVSTDDLLLEVGCGPGLPRVLNDITMKLYIGLDVSRRMIETSVPSRRNRIQFVVADAEHLPFRTGIFSKVISLETMEHLANPNLALREMVRVAQSLGVIAISVPSKFSSKVFNTILGLFETILRDRVRREMSRILSGSIIERSFSRAELVEMFRLSGAIGICTRRVGSSIPYGSGALLRIMLALERVVEAIQLPICAGLLIKATKP